jgi:hypothetical protein
MNKLFSKKNTKKEIKKKGLEGAVVYCVGIEEEAFDLARALRLQSAGEGRSGCLLATAAFELRGPPPLFFDSSRAKVSPSILPLREVLVSWLTSTKTVSVEQHDGGSSTKGRAEGSDGSGRWT